MDANASGVRAGKALGWAAALLLALPSLSCAHAKADPPAAAAQKPADPPPPPDPRIAASAASSALHDLLRSEAEAAWQRWTGGSGPAPGAAAAGKDALYSRAALENLQQAAAAEQDAAARRAFRLAWSTLVPRAVALAAGEPALALERARAQLLFAAPGDARPERTERDLDRLLSDEPSDQKRHAIAEAEAQAAQPLQPLAVARDAAEAQALAALGLPAWPALIEALQGRSPASLAALAEQTLAATDALADRALAATTQLNLGVAPDRLGRADLPRLVRTGGADAELPAGKGWENARGTLAALGADPAALDPLRGKLRVDAEPLATKAARPLALLVDPPADVRLSLRPAGGFDEQRALLHESARAVAGALTRAPRWELAALGDGSAAEGIALLLEGLAGDPQWLRASTALRGERLDDLVRTEATRRLLAVRRAAALVLFEVRRREQPQTAGAAAELYRSLLQRATRAQLSAADAGRWALEADGWVRAAITLRASLLGAALSEKLDPTASASAPAPAWWSGKEAAALLSALWLQGRSLLAEEAAAQAGVALEPRPLVALIERRLAYRAPEAPPKTEKPDYKFMQGDQRTRRRKAKKK